MTIVSRRFYLPILSTASAALLPSSCAFSLQAPSRINNNNNNNSCIGTSRVNNNNNNNNCIGTWFRRGISTTTTVMSAAASTNNNDNNANNANDDKSTAKKPQPIVQYIVLRRDLDWPAGAMAAQAAHASVAAIAQGLAAHHAPTAAYIHPNNVPHMTKYVYGVDTLEELEHVRDLWKEKVPLDESSDATTDVAEGSYYWWVEQPENIPAAFATWPTERTNKVSKVVKSMKLTFF